MTTTQQRNLVERTLLDEQMRELRRDDLRSWGLAGWLWPIVALAVIIAAGNVLADTVVPHQGTGRTVVGIVLTIGAELLLLAVLLAFGRAIAARDGGWRAAFGLDRIRKRDWVPWLWGLALTYAGRTSVGIVAAALTDGRAAREASNLSVGHPTVATVTTLALTACVLAPIAEELMFRGLLLRTFMRRMSFWPAAVLSTVLFGVFHVYEVSTVEGALTLAFSVGVLGLVNCYLVRITGRLTPGIMVHASFNALALVVALATGS
jgi:membrane protease YdiL (CAAX protease family)